MTVATNQTSGDAATPERPDLVTLTIDGVTTSVPKGTFIIRAAEQLGVAIPRFCDHPLLDAIAACRMCLIEVDGMPKPQPACAVQCSDGMVVKTQMTSTVADVAQRGVMEFLLINHPLDCPICDKGGECPLQNQAMTNGQGDARFNGPKRTFPKPIAISAQILLDRERCISCTRCTRFSEQIAGDPLIQLFERGAQQQIGVASDVPFHSYFSGNTIQICPVGALTSAMYRFRSRPFDLVSTPTACEHCASGCSLRTDSRRNTVMRRLAGVDLEVNEEWNCDKGRFAFRYLDDDNRLTAPLVRTDGELRRASWDEALAAAARGLQAARGKAGVITGGRLMVEDAYAYSMFARRVLGTNDVDFRTRPSSAEEEQFLAALVAGRGLGPTYAQLEAAPAVLLVAFEPEDESPIVLLRLRKAARAGTRVLSIAPAATRGLEKVQGTWLPATPGQEPSVVDALADGEHGPALSASGAVILVGERAAQTPGLLSAVARLADRTGAALGWVPRRAGDRGAVEAGLLPSLLPGGRLVSDPAARVDAAAIWGDVEVPQSAGRDLPAMLQAASDHELSALVVAGAQSDDLPGDAEAALRAVDHLVVLDTHRHALVELADVVLPVAAVTEKAGSFVNWEGRERPSARAIRSPLMSDARVLAALAAEMDADLGATDTDALRGQLAEFADWQGTREQPPQVAAAADREGGTRLATWRPLLEPTLLQSGEPYLAATARPQEVWLSAQEAAALGVIEGQLVTVTGSSGSVTAPLVVTEVAEGTVVVTGDAHRTLGRDGSSGDLVQLTAGGQA